MPPAVSYEDFVFAAAAKPHTRADHLRDQISDENLARLQHALEGLSSEVGELASEVKAHINYGKDLDILNIKEECGDIVFFLVLAVLAVDRNTTLEDIVAINRAKLEARYPNGFNAADALKRNKETEIAAMNAAV